jgi:hypothetical protein
MSFYSDQGSSIGDIARQKNVSRDSIVPFGSQPSSFAELSSGGSRDLYPGFSDALQDSKRPLRSRWFHRCRTCPST